MTSSTHRSFADFAMLVRPELEATLESLTQLPSGCPPRLAEAIRYSLLAPGKRLRPLLALLACEACCGRWQPALPVACAVEMIHAYSLVHDDLPAMDDDDLRRGRPTNHRVFGEGPAILAGDALLTLAFEVVARDVEPRERAADCCLALARAAGAAALVGGQSDDLAHERGEPFPVGQSSLVTLESIHARKTGAMIRVSLELGGRCGGATQKQLTDLDSYGCALGLAFQIADDLLDVEGDEQALGKRVGKDARRGKLTFPGLLGVAESRRRAERLVDDACHTLAGWEAAGEGLVSLARYVLERDR